MAELYYVAFLSSILKYVIDTVFKCAYLKVVVGNGTNY